MTVRMQIAATMILAAALAGAWLWFSGWGEAAKSNEPRPTRSLATLVRVEALDLAEDQVVLRVVGSGKALRSASLHPTVAGEVMKVLFEAEQKVKKGAPLIRLNDQHERLAVRLAEVAEKEALREIKRVEKLVPSGIVSVVRLETAQTALESASLRLAQARANLDDRSLYAPFDGVIALPEVDQGDRVTEDTMIATLDDRSAMLVEFTVPEEYVKRLKVGDPITVRPWTDPEQELRGVIHATDSRIDRATRTMRVRARIPTPDETVRPGTSFDVRLTFIGRAYPSVREVAVLWSRDGAYLWRVVGSRAEKVFVKMIRRNRGRVLVDGPLKAGDLIVVEGVQGLRDGQEVEPVPFAENRMGWSGPAVMRGIA